jgi:outer membrane cobalamin receptor
MSLPHPAPAWSARLLAALVSCAAAISPAGAQGSAAPPGPDTSAKTLGAVVVTATRSSTTLEHMQLHTTVITREQIEASPAQTVDQLLRQISGMNMPGEPYYTTDPTGNQTRMRGVTNSTVLVLVDGIPVLDPFYNTTQWFKVPLSSIDHIEIVRGGNSSLWGSLAVAGVVNIITRKPTSNGTSVDVSYGSRNTLDAAGAQDLLLGHGLALRLSGDVLNSGGYITTPRRYLSSYPGEAASFATNWNAGAALYYTPTAAFNAFLRAGYHQQNQDIGGYAYGMNLQRSPDVAGGFVTYVTPETHLDVHGWSQYVSFTKNNGAGCYLASPGTCNTTATTAPLVQYANSHDNNPYHEAGGSAVVSTSRVLDLPLDIQAGVDYRAIGGEDHSTTYNKPTEDDVASATINRTQYGQGSQQFVGAFTQFTAKPLTPLTLTVSLRYDYWANQDGIAELTPYKDGAPQETTGGAIPNSDKSAFDPSFSARYEVDSHLALRGAVYKAFRAPGLNNLYRSYSSTTSISIANPNLSTETLFGGEVGADVHVGPVTLGGTAFQYSTTDLIATYKVTSAAAAPAAVTAICGPTLSNCPSNINFNTNGQNALSRGLEFTGEWTAARFLSFDGAFTYTDSHYTFTTTGDPTGVQLGAIPKDVATLAATWRITPRWTGVVSGYYNGGMYLDVDQQVPQRAFALLDVSTAYQLTRQLSLWFAANNVTAVSYVDNATTSATSEDLGLPQTFTGGIRCRF